MDIDLPAIRRVAAEKGVAALSKEGGVPYTTLRSMEERDWSHRSIDNLVKLTDAARKLDV